MCVVSLILKQKTALKNKKLRSNLALFFFSPLSVANKMVLLLGFAAAVATVNDERVLDAGLRLDSLSARTMQTILAFLIVFRTNQSYNRWWEGRILWGKMHW